MTQFRSLMAVFNTTSMWAERNVHYTKQLAAVGRFELPSLVSRRFTMYIKYDAYIRSFLQYSNIKAFFSSSVYVFDFCILSFAHIGCRFLYQKQMR